MRKFIEELDLDYDTRLILENTMNTATKVFNRDGAANPLLILVNSHKIVPIPDMSPDTKRQLGVVLGVISEREPVILVTEAWMTMPRRMPDGGIDNQLAPRLDPQRQEAIMVQLLDKDRRIVFRSSINRTISGPVFAGEWEFIADTAAKDCHMVGCNFDEPGKHGNEP